MQPLGNAHLLWAESRVDTCGKPRIMMITLTCSMISCNRPAITAMFHVHISVHLLRFEGNRVKARDVRNSQEALSFSMEIYAIKLISFRRIITYYYIFTTISHVSTDSQLYTIVSCKLRVYRFSTLGSRTAWNLHGLQAHGTSLREKAFNRGNR